MCEYTYLSLSYIQTHIYIYIYILHTHTPVTGAVEYADCINVERQDPTNKSSGYDTNYIWRFGELLFL